MATQSVKEFKGIQGMQGFSDALISDHLKLYEGYVNNTNTLLEKLSALSREGSWAAPEFAEMKRRFGWEFDGMRLHELYFENLGGAGTEITNRASELLSVHFGSVEQWMNEFKGTGKMRGIGWVIMYKDPSNDRVMNAWINEHDVGHLAGCEQLLVMDVFEHAYIRDYGINRAEYIESFFKNINWDIVDSRLGK